MDKSLSTFNMATYTTRNLLQPNKSGGSFDFVFLEAVDEALSSLIGDSGRKTPYSHLKNSFNFKTQDVSNKIEQFAQAIEDIFGYGAKLIEIEILKCLYKKISTSVKPCRIEDFLKNNDLTFTDCINTQKVL